MFLFKACLLCCNSSESAVKTMIFTPFVQTSCILRSVCIYVICMEVHLDIHMCIGVQCHHEPALLLPRVYLQTVTLMQCNDYFYSRYFGSPLALNGMTPHWSTDYLCGCCHTWLLYFTPLFTIITSALPLLLAHLLFLPSCLSVYLSTKNQQLAAPLFLWCLL